MTPLDQVREKLNKLKEMQDQNHPGLPAWIQQIHRELIKDEAIVHGLTEDEIGMLVSAASKVSQTTLVQTVAKSKASKSLKNMTLGDL